jgi:hypothetical protein
MPPRDAVLRKEVDLWVGDYYCGNTRRDFESGIRQHFIIVLWFYGHLKPPAFI